MSDDDLLSAALSFSANQAGNCTGQPLVIISKAQTQFEAQVYDPVLCLILQGAKETTSPTETLRLCAGDALLVTHDTPVIARITKASPETPYVAVILPLDPGLLREFHDLTFETPNAAHSSAFGRIAVEPALRDALTRWLSLDPASPETAPLAALCRKEVHIRLITAPGGGVLRHLTMPGSHASRIARAIGEIRRDIATPIRLPDLARAAGMGQSAFHAHFKSITGTTPLQYQKDLRLTAARQRLSTGPATVTEVAFAVGYESAAQFSREYARKFGHPPSADLRREAAVA